MEKGARTARDRETHLKACLCYACLETLHVIDNAAGILEGNFLLDTQYSYNIIVTHLIICVVSYCNIRKDMLQ